MDKRLRLISILILISFFLIYQIPGEAATSPARSSIATDALEKVEPLVLEELETNQQTAFFIWLTEKADLSPAYDLDTKAEKGQLVYETLVATAERTQAELRSYLDGRGVDYRAFYIANKILVRSGDMDLVTSLTQRADVAEITANHAYQLEEPSLPAEERLSQLDIEPNITFIHADQVWALGYRGEGTVLAGNDTGLDETHPAIARHYRGCLNPPTCSTWDHNYNWWDATGEYPTEPWDPHGHGTHTTGIFIGDDGGSNQIGVAPGAQTIHCKNMTGGGGGDDSTFTECFQWDLAPWDLSGENPDPAMAPDVVNNAWGYWGGNQPQFKDEIQALHAAGILVEVSGGGDGPGCMTMRSPADYWEVLTTGMTTQTEPFPGIIAPFSPRGPSELDGNYFPDILAPGDNIRSSVPGNGYDVWSGTSSAGSHATGLVGLMWNACPDLAGQVYETIDLIHETAGPLTGQVGVCGGDYVTGPNNDWGYGTIDALAAVEAAIAHCTALGYLDGTVQDAITLLPIEGAQISADREGGNSWLATTDASGYYTLPLPNGSYTVTAASFGYYPETLVNVVVVTDTVTTRDFDLDLLPEHTVSGTVSDASSGNPLHAQVEVVGTPLDPVWSDPGTGFYSISVPEGTYTMRVSANLHQPEEREVLVDQDQMQDFALLPADVVPDPLIQSMIDQVDSDTVYSYTGGLSGEWPVWVDDGWYTISSRYTYSGVPIQKATHWTGEHFANLGLDVEYHQWGGATYPNVIAELPGLTNPEDIFIIGGHLDDMPSSGPAPGADDNASGSVAAMIAADILTQYQWGCTLRFALWTGEEQWMLGSEEYAQRSYQLGENILGYLNLDMIAWNTPGSDPDINLFYLPAIPPSQDLAQLFADVVEAYAINLIPNVLIDQGQGSDQQPFWDYGYNAILAIEDTQNDFNPYYHQPGDNLEHVDLAYYTEFAKAAIGTFAHSTGCLIPSGIGSLDGTVTAQNGGAPIQAALVVAEDGAGHSFEKFTDASGYYTRTLLAGTYDVTASAYGYLPTTVSGVTIVTDTVTTQDFALLDAPYYTVSGTVTEAGSGLPLQAEIAFEGSPVVVGTDPSTGFYSADLPEGTYTMHVSADLHEPESRPITLSGDRTEDFALNPLPCILLVDDDNNDPDVLSYYTAALGSLGYDYNVFDVGGGEADGPDLEGMQGYSSVIWFSGDKFSNNGVGSAGPNGTDEANLAAYLEDGGKLFLSSQDYLWDFELTPFGQDYLGIGSYTNDFGEATQKYGIAGDPIGDGLGPYPLTYPSGFSDYGDIVNAAADASVAFRSESGKNLDIDRDGGSWQTVFFGTSWVPVYNNSAANGEELLGRIIDWFGGCEAYGVSLSGDDARTGIPGETLTYTLAVTNTSISLTDTFTVSLGASVFPAVADAGEVGPLAPGEAAEFHVRVTIPESALPGAVDAVEVMVASQGDDGKFDSATLTTSVGGSYGVLLGSEQTQGEGAAGSTLTYTLSLTNSGSLHDMLVLTTTQVDPGWEVQLAQTRFDLAGGGNIVTTLQVTIPAGAAQGDFDAFWLQAASVHDPSKADEVEFTTTVSQGCTLPSEVSFTWSPSMPWAGAEVIFEANAQGSIPMTYTWDFGDGETGTGQQVMHLYATGGEYSVTLTASNACEEASLTQSVTVTTGVQLFLPVISKAP